MDLKPEYDVVVIGGGVNGAGIARDAAGRGLSVLLLEKGDLAQATSSASSKLIHGGLRYLEQYDFKLVSESLHERERVLKSAPHLVWPLRFVIPHEAHLRPAWMIRIGLFLYDHLAKRDMLPASRGLDLRTAPEGKVLQADYTKGFVYSDCWVDDARLVVLCAKDAAERGADIAVRSTCTGLKAEGNLWRVQIGDRHVKAHSVVNAAGPWARAFLDEQGLARPRTPKMRLMKGSHIIVKALHDGDHAYLLQQPDGRIVFVLPYQGGYSLIGTTDIEYTGDPLAAKISDKEVDYLCAAVNRSFRQHITADDIVSTYSGVRPLVDDGEASGSKVTRDYQLLLDMNSGAPLLNVFGGKLTTFRALSEQAVDKIAGFFDHCGRAWTDDAALPGGDIAGFDLKAFIEAQSQQYEDVPYDVITRLAKAYGTRMDVILDAERGRDFGHGIFEGEVRYLIREEWARSIDDILWRRSKLGLHISDTVRIEIEKILPELLREYGYG
jgi:glycerol-3-phosphate dehydrogenase